MNKVLVGIGLLVTVAYVSFGVWVLDDQLYQIKDLKLNELGDFLAGVFGPLALLWLILGFFQQGMELKLTREALSLQADELSQSVEQQREMVTVAREQLDTEVKQNRLRNTPVFSISEDRSGLTPEKARFAQQMFLATGVQKYNYVLVNKGALAKNVEILIPDDVNCTLEKEYHYIDSNFRTPFSFCLSSDTQSPVTLNMSFTDSSEEHYNAGFEFVYVKVNDKYIVDIHPLQ